MTKTTTFTVPRSAMSAWALRELASRLGHAVRLRPWNRSHYFATIDTQEPRVVLAIRSAIEGTS